MNMSFIWSSIIDLFKFPDVSFPLLESSVGFEMQTQVSLHTFYSLQCFVMLSCISRILLIILDFPLL